MIRLRKATVSEVLDERPGAVEVSVALDPTGEPPADPLGLAVAVVYPALVGPVGLGDRVLVNTTAVELGLGTGGVHFVVAVERSDAAVRSLADIEPAEGRTMKLRYTPHQVAVTGAEEQGSHAREAIEDDSELAGVPVVWIPLHSMLGPAAAGARAAGASRVVYVMTDRAALPAPLSRVAAALRAIGLLEAVISTGQAFGGDLDTVNVFTGLLGARRALNADVVVVGDGPGNLGTATTWGASVLEAAMAMNAAGILGGRPVATLRVSFVDPRQRHRPVSHHSITALSRVALVPVHVAVPAIDDDARRRAVWTALTAARLEERHQLVEVNGRPALDLLAQHGFEPESMGRSPADDPEFFLGAGAAGVLAGRMATGDRAWDEARPRAPE